MRKLPETRNNCGRFLMVPLLTVLLALPSGVGRGAGEKVQASRTSKAVLLRQKDLVYLGAFRVPKGRIGSAATHGNSFSTDAGRALSYNPTSNSLFMMGNKREVLLAELDVPERIVKSTNRNDLAIARVRQPPFDVTGGLGCFIGPGGSSKCSGNSPYMSKGNVLLGGTLVDSAMKRLVGTTYAVYDAKANATLSHFTASLNNWDKGGARVGGMYRVGSRIEDHGALSAGFVAGYMGWIPSEWQDAFGGPAVTGQAAVAIISRTSYGPAAFVFDPRKLGNADSGSEGNPLPVIPLVYYPGTHQTLGRYDNKTLPNPLYNQATEITGVVFPAGSRSLLFFGRTGLGVACYGSGTVQQRQVAGNAAIKEWLKANNPQYPTITTPYACGSSRLDGNGNIDCCFDPASSYKGVHAYPYAYYVWAYDALDLLKVKEGRLKPWEVIPYAEWDLNADLDPFTPDGNDGVARRGIKRISGAAYDPATQRIYLAQANGDKLNAESLPLIHVFNLKPLEKPKK